MKKRNAFIIGLFILLFGATMFVLAQTADERLKMGDEYYSRLENQKALEEYMAAVQADPGNYEALWKTSRALIDVADLIDTKKKGGEDKQKSHYRDSATYARKAIAAKADDTWGHFYLSAALGKYALLLGKKEQIQMSREIKAEIEKAIGLDGTNDLAYHALGRWHRRIAEIGGAKRFFGSIIYGSIPKGSFEESEKALKKAGELKPDYINHHLELGRTYVSLEKYDLAVQEFQKCLDLPASTAKDPDYKKEAEAEMAQAKKEIK